MFKVNAGMYDPIESGRVNDKKAKLVGENVIFSGLLVGFNTKRTELYIESGVGMVNGVEVELTRSITIDYSGNVMDAEYTPPEIVSDTSVMEKCGVCIKKSDDIVSLTVEPLTDIENDKSNYLVLRLLTIPLITVDGKIFRDTNGNIVRDPKGKPVGHLYDGRSPDINKLGPSFDRPNHSIEIGDINTENTGKKEVFFRITKEVVKE